MPNPHLCLVDSELGSCTQVLLLFLLLDLLTAFNQLASGVAVLVALLFNQGKDEPAFPVALCFADVVHQVGVEGWVHLYEVNWLALLNHIRYFLQAFSDRY